MNDRRLSDSQITTALRAHLPAYAQAGLRARVFESVEATSQQRPLPSFLGALSDVDPVARRRSLLLAAAVLALVLASAAAVGAWRMLQPPDPLKVDIVPQARGLLALIREGDLYLATPDGTGVVLAAHVDGIPLSDPRWSPDGRWILVQTAEPAVLRVDQWSPDGMWIAYVSASDGAYRGSLNIIRPDGRDRRTLVAGGVSEIVGWGPDGTSIAYSAGDGRGAGTGALREVKLDSGASSTFPMTEATDFAWALIPPTAGSPVVPPSRAASNDVAPADEPAVTPLPDPAADPSGTWSGLGFSGLGHANDAGDDLCGAFILTFPDRVGMIVERPGAISGASPATSPTLATPPPVACGGVRWAPDASAYIRVMWGQVATVDVFARAGEHLWGPTMMSRDPIWSPDSAWIGGDRCADARVCRDVIMRPDGSNLREFPGRPTWSADGHVLAVSAPDGTLLVGRVDGSDLKAIGVFPPPTSWAPDGASFAYVRDGDVWVAARDGSGSRNLTNFGIGGAAAAAWSPDGHWIAVLRGQGLWIFAADGTQGMRIWSGRADPLTAIAWSPDGAWLAAEASNDFILYRAGEWHPIVINDAWGPVWSPDGQYLAFTSSSPEGDAVTISNADGSGRRIVWIGSVAGGFVWTR